MEELSDSNEMKNELWRFIDDSFYEVSNYGRVRNFKTGKLLKPYLIQRGYYRVRINGKQCLIHRLVATYFLDNPDELPVVNHKDGNRGNNFVGNLEWSSFQQNSRHAVDVLKRFGRKICQYSLSDDLIKKWESVAEASRKLEINRSCISACINGNRKTAGGFKWEAIEPLIKEPSQKIISRCLWKTIEEYPNYKISSKGQVMNKNSGKIRKLTEDNGYLRVSLSKNGRQKFFSVQRLVAIHFIENPDDLPIVNHKDGNKQNNDVNNLEWVSCQDNIIHAVETELMKPASERAVVQYDAETGEKIAEYKSIKLASENTPAHPTCISQNCSGKIKTAGGFIWRYKDEAPEKVEIEIEIWNEGEYKYEKKPCKECGKLISEPAMNRHIKEIHKRIPRGTHQ